MFFDKGKFVHICFITTSSVSGSICEKWVLNQSLRNCTGRPEQLVFFRPVSAGQQAPVGVLWAWLQARLSLSWLALTFHLPFGDDLSLQRLILCHSDIIGQIVVAVAVPLDFLIQLRGCFILYMVNNVWPCILEGLLHLSGWYFYHQHLWCFYYVQSICFSHITSLMMCYGDEMGHPMDVPGFGLESSFKYFHCSL